MKIPEKFKVGPYDISVTFRDKMWEEEKLY